MQNNNKNNQAETASTGAKKSFVAAFMQDGGQNAALKWLLDNHAPVSIFLVTGVKFDGTITAFDQYTISIQDVKGHVQLIYKDKISTLAQKRPGPSFSGSSAPRTRNFNASRE